MKPNLRNLTQDSADDQMPYLIPSTGMANPTSENYVKQGVKLIMEERVEMGDFDVCYFEDNRQCEEWTPFCGECTVGDLKVTGYVAEAARFCAITGCEYAIIGNSSADSEQGLVCSRPACLAMCWNATTSSVVRTGNPLVDTLLSLVGDCLPPSIYLSFSWS
jgi:putative hemolysin